MSLEAGGSMYVYLLPKRKEKQLSLGRSGGPEYVVKLDCVVVTWLNAALVVVEKVCSDVPTFAFGLRINITRRV